MSPRESPLWLQAHYLRGGLGRRAESHSDKPAPYFVLVEDTPGGVLRNRAGIYLSKTDRGQRLRLCKTLLSPQTILHGRPAPGGLVTPIDPAARAWGGPFETTDDHTSAGLLLKARRWVFLARRIVTSRTFSLSGSRGEKGAE